ncbi:hypothetical protein N8H71_01280 [Pseudomonas koreensis]|uniref:hypothetical protein n=1 Tax=Pseudomonas koreensis TaxID=198620 RepID=UPI0021C5C626|nr:hypothetical protein [Pseudomonas koreensis]MCU0070199.1 hypothetical protein [Pseudomonas koreensis]
MTRIASAADLWESLCKSAGLELRLKGGGAGRDIDVEDAVRKALGVPVGTSSLADWLAADAASSCPQVSTEQLLVEVLKSQVGFASMMQDILDVLILAETRESRHQLSVEFKFDKVSDPIKATLEQFRETVQRTQRILERRPKLPDREIMFSISMALREKITGFPINKPDNFPPVPVIAQTGQAEIDAQMRLLTRLVSAFRELWLQHGKNRDEVLGAANALNNPHSIFLVWDLPGQLYAASDFWDIGMIAGMQDLASQVKSGQMAEETVLKTLNDAVEKLEWGDVWVEHTIQELLDLLNLPVWRRRHELYSVWVGTRMLKVIKTAVADMRFHTVDGVLSFEFGGSRVASFNCDNKQFDVWAELRSALVGKSSKRSKGIQPDFRVLKVNLLQSAGAQTTYVLECKHYLNASTTNFTQAASDYARSCPNAVVHIVNHGPADNSVLTAVLPTELQARAKFIGDATPKQETETGALSAEIRNTLFPGLPQPVVSAVVPTSDNTALATDIVCSVQLVWDASLKDMDLALRVVNPDGSVTESIDFRNHGALDALPYARFEEDVRSGPGSERIEISRWYFSRYELIATNYSKAGQMTPQALHCNIETAQGTAVYYPNAISAVGNEWKIAELHVNDGVATVVPCR